MKPDKTRNSELENTVREFNEFSRMKRELGTGNWKTISHREHRNHRKA